MSVCEAFGSQFLYLLLVLHYVDGLDFVTSDGGNEFFRFDVLLDSVFEKLLYGPFEVFLRKLGLVLGVSVDFIPYVCSG